MNATFVANSGFVDDPEVCTDVHLKIDLCVNSNFLFSIVSVDSFLCDIGNKRERVLNFSNVDS